MAVVINYYTLVIIKYGSLGTISTQPVLVWSHAELANGTVVHQYVAS